MPHWRTLLSNDYVSSADLYVEETDSFRELTVTIERVKGGEVVGEGGLKSKKPFIYFVGSRTGKPLAIGATNGTSIARLAGSEDYKRWPGTRLTLFVTKTKARGGEMVNCIRIKDPPPAQAQAQEDKSDGAMTAEQAAREES